MFMCASQYGMNVVRIRRIIGCEIPQYSFQIRDE